MNKQEFLSELRKNLSGLPEDDIEERLTFYSEMLDDRMEDGLTEEEAVNDIGTVDELTAQIIADIPLTKLVKERITPKKKLSVWAIILIVLGFPVWFPILIAAFAVIFSLYVSILAVIISLWAVFASFAASGLSCIITGIVLAFGGKGLTGIASLCAGFVLAGLSIFLFFGCKAATKGILILTKKLAMLIKNCFIKKEDAR